jgi:hypothetical protein
VCVCVCVCVCEHTPRAHLIGNAHPRLWRRHKDAVLDAHWLLLGLRAHSYHITRICVGIAAMGASFYACVHIHFTSTRICVSIAAMGASFYACVHIHFTSHASMSASQLCAHDYPVCSFISHPHASMSASQLRTHGYPVCSFLVLAAKPYWNPSTSGIIPCNQNTCVYFSLRIWHPSKILCCVTRQDTWNRPATLKSWSSTRMVMETCGVVVPRVLAAKPYCSEGFLGHKVSRAYGLLEKLRAL